MRNKNSIDYHLHTIEISGTRLLLSLITKRQIAEGKTENMRVGQIDNIRKAYLELWKLIYLPYIYGYDFNCISQCAFEVDRIIWDLNRIRNKTFETPNDIHLVVEAIVDLSDQINDPSVSNSKYLQLQADEYVRLFDAITDEEVNAKHQVLTSLQSFKQKKD